MIKRARKGGTKARKMRKRAGKTTQESAQDEHVGAPANKRKTLNGHPSTLTTNP